MCGLIGCKLASIAPSERGTVEHQRLHTAVEVEAPERSVRIVAAHRTEKEHLRRALADGESVWRT
jgi:hypothetical protein